LSGVIKSAAKHLAGPRARRLKILAAGRTTNH